MFVCDCRWLDWVRTAHAHQSCRVLSVRFATILLDSDDRGWWFGEIERELIIAHTTELMSIECVQVLSMSWLCLLGDDVCLCVAVLT